MKNIDKFKKVTSFIRKSFGASKEIVPLHEPHFRELDKQYLVNCIDSTFVSSVGQYVVEFENSLKNYTGALHCVAMVNGTAALHIALLSLGVENEDEVLTQSLTFVATANAIKYCNANPIFIDSSKDNLGMCPQKLHDFLSENCTVNSDGFCINRKTQKRIRACVPMHVFGNFVDIKKIVEICKSFGILVVEDSAEALGSFLGKEHSGLFGDVGIFSFNGNKIITCGGGGAVITNNREVAERARHLSTTAKVGHPWEYFHDQVGYNYRMPNLNASLACAQMFFLEEALSLKKSLANAYSQLGIELGFKQLQSLIAESPNNWLNYYILNNIDERNSLIEFCHNDSILVRPLWTPMHKLPAYKDCQATNLENTNFFEERVVCLPSSVVVR